MPSLEKSLSRHDLGHLQIIAELWGIDLQAPSAQEGVRTMRTALLQPDLLTEIIDTLPPESQQALMLLVQNQGRLPWHAFERQFGPLRQMGPAKRDRELPHLAPISTTEVLFYHGLLARDFLNTPQGAQEFAYLPDEFLEILAQRLPSTDQPPSIDTPPGRPARPDEHSVIQPADDRLLNDLTTLLAARRIGWQEPPHPLTVQQDFLEALLARLGILTKDHLDPRRVKTLLETPRPLALTRLAQTWLGSDINDLCLIPQLACEGSWQYDPLAVRSQLLEWLHDLPETSWWSLPAFIEDVHRKNPDFLRSGGQYQAWLIRHRERNTYLKGFESWKEVEGALLRYLISGPLHWLGLLDLAGPTAEETLAFRRSPLAASLLANRPAEGLPIHPATVSVSAEGEIKVAAGADLALRYQLARFGEWENSPPDVYVYRITSASLQRAASQGLTGAHLLALLRRYKVATPPALETALKRWQKDAQPAARLQPGLVLRVNNPQILDALQKRPERRYIIEQLTPTVALIQPAARAQVQAALAALGWLTEDQSKGDE